MLGHYFSVALLNFRKAPIQIDAARFVAGSLIVVCIAWLAVCAQTLRADRARGRTSPRMTSSMLVLAENSLNRPSFSACPCG